jgi:hypothetical protein
MMFVSGRWYSTKELFNSFCHLVHVRGEFFDTFGYSIHVIRKRGGPLGSGDKNSQSYSDYTESNIESIYSFSPRIFAYKTLTL